MVSLSVRPPGGGTKSSWKRTSSSDDEDTGADMGHEDSITEMPSSNFRTACIQAVKEQHEGPRFRPTFSTITEDQSTEERLRSMDRKLDRLTEQMGECLSGIRVLYLTGPGNGSAPAPRPSPQLRKSNSHLMLGADRIPATGRQAEKQGSMRVPRAAGDVALANAGGSNRSSINSSITVQSRMSRIEEAFGPARPDHSKHADGTSSMASAIAAFRNRASMSASFRPRSRDDLTSGSLVRDSGPLSPRGGPLSPKGSGMKVQKTASDWDDAFGENGTSLQVTGDSKQSVASWIQQRQRTQGTIALTVWNLLDNPDSGLPGRLYNRIMPLLILTAVGLSLSHALFPDFLRGQSMVITEMSIESFFFIEIVTRFFVCPNRWTFFFSLYNIIDIMSALPLGLRIYQYVEAGIAVDDRGFVYVVLLGFVPALRLLKTWRRFQQIHLLTKAFRLAAEALPVMLFIYIVVWLFFTAAVYVVEDKSNIPTLGQAMWLTFCSMTSSMFGDLYPKSLGGKVIISVLVLISTLYMAIPIGIIGTCFSEVWTDRDRILLVERMRRVFKQNGFGATDIPDLFAHFDVDHSGLLDIEEFENMATNLKLGLSQDRLLSLFQMLDDDGSGGIDDREFCRAVFPEAYHQLYVETKVEEKVSEQTAGPMRSMGRRLSLTLIPSFLLPSGANSTTTLTEGRATTSSMEAAVHAASVLERRRSRTSEDLCLQDDENESKTSDAASSHRI